MLGGISQLTSYGAGQGRGVRAHPQPRDEGAAHGIRVNALAPRADTRMSASDAERLAAMFSMDAEAMAQVQASMPPQLCSPAALYLGHESCPLSGRSSRSA